MAISVKPGPKELLAQVRDNGVDLYKEAYRAGMSLSAWLEKQHPVAEYKDGLDAFSRLLYAAEIRVQSDPINGIAADKFGDFERKGLRSLVPEWAARQWRKATLNGAATVRASNEPMMFTSADDAFSWILRPYQDVGLRPRYAPQMRPAIPLDELIAYTTPLDGEAYVAYYIEDPDPDEVRMVRITEGAEIPRAKIRAGEFTVRLQKYGRGLEMTYEHLRRQRIDKVALWIQRLAIQTEHDKVAAAMEVLINGDGNPNTSATVYTPADLVDGATDVNLKVWIAFKTLFESPYTLSTVLTRREQAQDLLLLDFGTANHPLFTYPTQPFGGFRPINPGLDQNPALGWLSTVPEKKIIGFDRNLALERVYEIGANLTEVERYVTRQTQVMVMTEVEGYSVFDPNAAKILDLA